ncbi:MAG: histidine phosphatase family protein, partial [Lachnospiraceae bacterium]|nr:histidine phosphatase family protein [Lachnospiraceae bacterium]
VKRSDYLSNIIKIYLIRHARQNSTLCNVNVPLAEEGIKQSQLIGQRLKAYNISKVYSSDLIRAVMTADIIRCEIDGNMDNRNCELIELREMDFGELTGLPDSVLRVKYANFFAARDLKLEDLRIPGGENGEEVYARMDKAINYIIEDTMRNDGENVAVISHGGAIRCYLAGLLGMSQSHRYMIAKNMENTSITEIQYNVDKKVYSVERINDYSHLEGYDNLLRKSIKR